MKRPLIIAHRGASRRAPENTMAAFKLAIETGADGVEFDVRLSSDGVPVVIHDADLTRVGGKKNLVEKTTAADLTGSTVGIWFNKKYPDAKNPEFPDETIPTLAAVLDLYEKTTGPIFIELKCDTPDVADLVRAVCEEIALRPSITDRVIIKSFRLAAIAAVKQCLPQIETAALFEPSIMTFLRRRSYMVDLAKEFGAGRLSLHFTLAAAKLTAYTNNAGLPVTVWTVDHLRWLDRCRERSIDSLITNDPAIFV